VSRRRDRSPRHAPRAAAGPDQIEGRNPVLEALRASERVQRLMIDERARPDAKLQVLLDAASRRGLVPDAVPRRELDQLTEGRVHNGVVALARPLVQPRLPELIEQLADQDTPVLLLLDEVQYEQNLGAILRTADAAGVSGVVIPKRRGARLSPVAQRIAMGAAEHVPVVQCAILEAMTLLRRAAFRLVGADEHSSVPYTEVDLTGPLGLVMGGEDKGLTPPVRKRCDALVSIPMHGHVPSLNVSVSVGVLLFERNRQDP
jgi:23S rRNA (guanosine2251-2'-O)-methyltransferase